MAQKLFVPGCVLDGGTDGVADRVRRGPVKAARHQVRLRQGRVDGGVLQGLEDTDIFSDVGGHGVEREKLCEVGTETHAMC